MVRPTPMRMSSPSPSRAAIWRTACPRTSRSYPEEIREALADPLASVVDAIKGTLEKTPPELSADIIDNGIVLTGGGALLRGLDQLVERETGISVRVAENPLDCVAMGTGLVLENIDEFRKTLADEDSRD